MHMHQINYPKGLQVLKRIRSDDGGQFIIAAAVVDGRDVALIGHQPPSNVGEPETPTVWFRASAYRF